MKEFKVAAAAPPLSKFADKFIVEGGGRRPTTAATVAMVLLNTALHRSDILERKIPGEVLGGGTQFNPGQKFEAWREKFLS